ncbi:SDR family NAD(P)-dependent oxidoreductase [Phytohabitans kaempferiae]|uniref:SDR family NAD(P)-dependent oxidoreductase n=1 Tax=Phytohabitans kaempferiae TaxID=1620943 RepID=A0ABV6M3N5_9ACTN
MTESLAGSAVVVTGAIGGIGAAVARMLAAEGVAVYAVDLDSERLAGLVNELPGGGHRALAADLRDLGSYEGILDAVRADGRPLAGLAHLAAVLRRRHRLEDITEEDWDLQVDTNLKATFFLNRAVGLFLARQGAGGAIVNLASQGWWTGGLGGSVVYNAAKGGMVTMSRGLARTLAADRVRVNTVAPGFVDTAMMRGGMTEEQLAAAVAMVPLGRLATPEEVADAVVYLLRPGARYVTGATLNVSGGQLMY